MSPIARRWSVLAVCVLCACGDGTTGPAVPGTLAVTPSNWLAVGAGVQVQFEVLVRDADGQLQENPDVEWEISIPQIASVDANGLVTAVADGVVEVRAVWMGAEGSASLEVYVPNEPSEYLPGVSYFGRNDYTEYLPGTLPIVISAPHGGSLQPDEIPDRTYGVIATDRETEPTIRAVREAFLTRMGAAPSIVVTHLRRNKLDPNREVVEAAQGSPFAERAWAEHHGFIDRGKADVSQAFGWGLYLDLHGHGHPEARLELGYLLSPTELALDAPALDALADESSLLDLASRTSVGFSELIRGDDSLGSLLAALGVRAVPSGPEPDPGTEPYFRGGYSTARHGSRDGGVVSGIQLELNFEGIRDTAPNREAFAAVLAEAVDAFLDAHIGPEWDVPPGSALRVTEMVGRRP
ncbi:MAG: Ig-like domain-containing protein [Longimicrobiales bacterium]